MVVVVVEVVVAGGTVVVVEVVVVGGTVVVVEVVVVGGTVVVVEVEVVVLVDVVDVVVLVDVVDVVVLVDVVDVVVLVDEVVVLVDVDEVVLEEVVVEEVVGAVVVAPPGTSAHDAATRAISPTASADRNTPPPGKDLGSETRLFSRRFPNVPSIASIGNRPKIRQQQSGPWIPTTRSYLAG